MSGFGPEGTGRVEDIEYAAAWLPPPNVLKGLPNLKVIFSLGAGVDAILKDPTLPANIPIVRVNDDDLTKRMTEYIVLHVLLHHRQQRRIDANQKQKNLGQFSNPCRIGTFCGHHGAWRHGTGLGAAPARSRLSGGGLEPQPENHSGVLNVLPGLQNLMRFWRVRIF